MIIKAYYKWPKLSTLKRGDKIRVRDDGFYMLTGSNYTKLNGKMVTVKQIIGDYLSIYEMECDECYWYYYSRFEIKL